ncbi:MAG: hypothetical protein IKG23_05095 [Clostridia bacterium]|nr:hypothetical protein [Clostridia bacterium]
MDIIMKRKPAGMDNITIRCKNRPNWIRIIILTLAYALIGWLAFGLFCTLLEGSLGFWQALITPLGLIFLGIDLVTSFISNRKDIDR